MEEVKTDNSDESQGNITMERKLITSFSWTFLNFRDAIRLLKLDPDTLTFQSKELEVAGTKGFLQLQIVKRIIGSPPQITHLELLLSFQTNRSFWKFAPPLFNGPTVMELAIGKDNKKSLPDLYCKTSWSPASRWMTRICATSIPNCDCDPHSECTCGPFLISCKIFGISQQSSITETVAEAEPEIQPCAESEEVDLVLEILQDEAKRAFAHFEKGSDNAQPKLYFLCRNTPVTLCPEALRLCKKLNDEERRDTTHLLSILEKYDVKDVRYFCEFLNTGKFLDREKVDRRPKLLDLSFEMGCDLLTKYIIHVMTPRETTVFRMMLVAKNYPGFEHVTAKCLKFWGNDTKYLTEQILQSPHWRKFVELNPNGAVELLEIIARSKTPTTNPEDEIKEPRNSPDKTVWSLSKFWADNHITIKLYLGLFVSFAMCLLSWWMWYTMGTGQEDVPFVPEKPHKPEKWSKKHFYGGKYHNRHR